MWKMIHRNYRRLVAFMLTVAMVITNAGMNLTVAFAAGENENALFLVEGAELKAAIREAEKEGEVFKFSSLELKAGKKSAKNRYEKLLGTKDGKVYQLDLDIDDSFAKEDTSLEVFYNAGTDNVIFLFINESDMVVSFRVNIDGYETEPVTVNPNTVNVEDDENPSYAENYEAGDMIDDVQKKLGAEVLNPQETPAEEETSESESVPDENKPEEVLPPEETPSPEETMPPEETETTEDGNEGTDPGMTDESQAGTQESEPVEEETVAEETTAEETEAETEAPETEAPEAEAESEEEAVQENDPEAENDSDIEEIDNQGEAVAKAEALLNVSRHETAVVAVSAEILEDGDDADSAADEISPQEEENEAEETEAEPTDEETAGADAEETAKDSEDKTEESQPETAGTEEETNADEPEAETKGETLPSEETGADETKGETSGGSSIGEANEGEPGEIIGNDKNEEPSAAPDDSIADDENVPDSGNNGNDSLMEEDGQLLEDDSIELLGKLKGKEYNTVTIRDHANAKALRVEWKDIQEIISSSEYMVDYVAEPFDAASVKGADSVAEGENLYFAVEPENGYEITGVTANGLEVEEIEDRADLASASNWKGYPHVYMVEEVTEDLEINIELEELAPIIAAAVYTDDTDDAVFTVDVPDGAFEEEVELHVEKITEEDVVKELTDQASAALKENQVVASVLAYDVAFISKETGEEVEPLKPVEVSIRYKNSVVPEEVDEKDVTNVSVVHLPENQEAEVVASVDNVDETEFVFRADSFSPVLVLYGGEEKVESEGIKYSSLNAAIRAIEGSGDESVQIKLLKDIDDEPYVMTQGKSFTLDLSGHTFSSTSTLYKALYVSGENSTVIITSSAEGGVISAGKNAKGGVKVYEGATLILQKGNIENGRDSYGGGVYVEGEDSEKGTKTATFQMDGGIISNNSATSGGAVYVAGIFRMNGGTISNNSATNGGAVYVGKNGIFTMNGDSTILNNTASENGGGIYSSGNKLELTGGTISENINGAIHVVAGRDAITTLKNVTITQNEGGKAALYVHTVGEVTVENCEICDNDSNSAIQFAGTLHPGDVGQNKLLNNCKIHNNVSNASTIMLSTYGDCFVKKCMIYGNVATNNAGGIYNNEHGNLHIQDSRIIGNGGGSTGAIRIQSVTNVNPLWKTTVENTVIKTNRATKAKGNTVGGVYLGGGRFELKSGALYNNLGKAKDFYNSSGYRGHEYALCPASKMTDFEAGNEIDFSGYAWLGGMIEDGKDQGEMVGGAKEVSLTAGPNVQIPIARIGKTEYMSLREAVAAANGGEEIHVIVGDSGWTNEFSSGKIDIDKPVVINLNGCNIEASEGTLFNVKQSGNLTLRGKSAIHGKITVDESGTLEMDGGITSLVRRYGSVIICPLEIEVLDGTFVVNGEIPDDLGMTLNVSLAEGQCITAGEGFNPQRGINITLDEGIYNRFNQANVMQPLDDVLLIKGCSDKKIAASVDFTPKFTNPYVSGMVVDGNVVLGMRTISEGVFVDSKAGDDSKGGSTPETAVQNIEKALELAQGGKTIYVMNQIEVNQEVRWENATLKRYLAYKGNLVKVSSGGRLTLNSITLDGGGDEGIDDAKALVQVERRGKLLLETGTTLQNNDVSLTGYPYCNGGGIFVGQDGNVEINGGNIQDCYANEGGGIYCQGEVVLNNGLISGNRALCSAPDRKGGNGGGIFATIQGRVIVNGGIVKGNTANVSGGGISIGSTRNFMYKEGDHEYSLEIHGGRIEENTATLCGGGVFIQSDYKGVIDGKKDYVHIVGNKAIGDGVNFAGGGVYVNGGKDSSIDNGFLQLYNVVVRNNECVGGGGGLAGCGTSNTRIYVTNGGAIYENESSGKKSDIKTDKTGPIGIPVSDPYVFISSHMLGGGAYNWKYVSNNKPVFLDELSGRRSLEIYTDCQAEDENAKSAENLARVFITNNSSGQRGGGIGSNGDVTIGSRPTETIELTIEKRWDDTGFEQDRPQSVEFDILRSTGEGDTEEVYGRVQLVVTGEGEWKPLTVTGLPRYSADGKGKEYIYTVKEIENGYKSEVKEKEGEINSFVVTNTPTYALTLKKEVEGPATSDAFTFKITLNNADGSPFSGDVETTRSGGAEGTLKFTNGEASVTLKKDETIQLQNLKPDMTYKIEETDNGGAKETNVTIDGEAVEAAEGTIKLGGNINVVVFTNTFEEEKPETGTLTVRKMVEGTAGETERDFRFQVTLNDDSINGEFSGLKFEKGVSEEFALRHGQVRTISNLPAGVGYMVEELGAQELQGEEYEISFKEDGKDTVVTEARITGTVGAGETVNVICTNKKDKPDEPDKPGRPNRPGGGGGGTPSGPRGGGNTPGGPGTTTIDEPGVPLANLPGEPVTEMIEEQDVPLSALPKTGDSRHNGMLMMMFGMAGLGMLLAAAGLKKRKDESDQ